MGNKFKQKTVPVNYKGRTIETVVIVDRLSAELHLPSSAFLLNKRLNNLKVSSTIKYASILLSLLEEINLDPALESFDDLTDAHMSSYLEKVLYEERGVKTGTLQQHIPTISKFFSFLYEQGWSNTPNRFTFHVNPNIEHELAKYKGRQNSLDRYRLTERYIPEEDFNELLKHESSKGTFERERNEIILRLGYEVGMRAAETVSFDNFTIFSLKAAIKKSEKQGLNEVEIAVIGKGRGAGKVRTVVIPPNLRRKIERYFKNYSSIIGNHLITSAKGAELDSEHASVIFRRAKKNLIKNAPLEAADRWSCNDGWTFHACRHSYATNLAIKILTGELYL